MLDDSMNQLTLQLITKDAFAPFGDLIEADGDPDKWINDHQCGRFHDRAKCQVLGENARLGISIFKSQLRPLPYAFNLVERHPLGSQAFIPMSHDPFMVIAAHDEAGKPAKPQAFLTKAGQSINFHANIWHGVLSPVRGIGLFAVIDRIGDGNNLEEFLYPSHIQVVDADNLLTNM